MDSDVQPNVLYDILRRISIKSILKLASGLRPQALYKILHDFLLHVSFRPLARAKPKNLFQLLQKAAAGTAGNGISIYSPGGIAQVGLRLSYVDLLTSSSLKAGLLSQIDGIKDDSVVLLHFDNHRDGIEWFWAVSIAGYIPAISTPFTHDVEARKKHLIHLQTVLKNPIILTSEHLVPEFLDLECLSIRTIESIQAGKNEGIVPILNRGLLKKGDDIAALMLTSGSTGHAKAVTLRHNQMLTSVSGKSIHHSTTPKDKFLNWIGLDHVANLTETHLHSMNLAAEQVHVQASDLLVDPLRFLIFIARHRITHTFAPNFFLASLRTALEKPEPFAGDILDLSCLRVLISGGEQCVVETCQALTSLLHKYGVHGEVIRPGFGMTETCAGSIYNRNCPSYDISNQSEFASLGSCVPGISMRVTSDSGEVVAKNEIGNLEVSGPIVFEEYFNNSKATAESFTQDGWFVTGDRALIDATGRLQMTGRAKENIIINGVKYFPHEVETALEEARIDGVTPSYTAVFPHRPKSSQTEVLCVVYLPSYDADDVLARVKATDAISTICTMQCGVRPYDIIPLTAVHLPKSSLGKLSRAKIRTAFETGVFAEFKTNNDTLLQEYRASQRQAPTNGTEASILKVFSETFDIPEEDIGINTSLFEMGVSSIEIIRLKTRIESELSLPNEIPIITIMTNPTISALSLALLELSNPKEYNPIVTLQSGGSKTPLFLVHPGVGEVLVFLNLAKYIVDRPIYALRARGFDADEKPFTSIPEIVSTYHTAIKRVQPTGPYAIAGYSYGSMLAVEIAKVLESDNEEVKFVGVFNLPPHIKFRMRQLDRISVLLHLAYFLDLMTEEHAHAISPAMHLLSPDEVLSHVLEQSPQARLSEMALDTDKLRKWTDISHGLHVIAHDYDPSSSVSKMDVFYAIPLAAVAKDKQDWMENHLSKWDGFVNEEVKFHEVDGAHYTMLGPDNVLSFQKKLRAVLRERGI
ncbi:putative non-ribosomal peptide synthase-like protein [Mollisia scopiformis]|uniref:Putative non-ribosomal peptide synthase-like protein n=1 Tax=Mollisia scopiformis TaxID=149040 RepID=A0A132B1X8_MOLSC|nr:putative non-ribosomal peptide synthase-like protein [Mollisia scopiformis]KUJ06386.1 putative non-ribosomal peptide synthase-like protein [Mollisia scopiformis]